MRIDLYHENDKQTREIANMIHTKLYLKMMKIEHNLMVKIGACPIYIMKFSPPNVLYS